MEKTEVILAGAGIIGLSTALHLALSGVHATVLERGQAMSEASWAAAGMLAAHDPDNPPVLQPISELSLQLYPRFLDELERLSHQRVGMRTHLTLQGSARGSSFSQKQRTCGRLLSSQEVQELAPGLVSTEHEFLLLEEQSLDPSDLRSALPKAATAAGVTLHEQTEVSSVETFGNGVRVHTGQESFATSTFVNCCGAWAASLLSRIQSPAPEYLGIEPRKGQIVTVTKPELAQLSVVIRTPEVYLVPRGDGRVLIGATLERAGFNKEVNEATTLALIQAAEELYPPIKGAQPIQGEIWAGLRPGSADGLPLMGLYGPHQWIATGHFRNGILLGPATGHLMSKLIRGENSEIPLEAFGLERFSTTSL
jgi:glycine oxidase